MHADPPPVRIAYDRLADFCERVLVAGGAEPAQARHAARGLCYASLRGIDSHGVRLLPHYYAALKGGRVNGAARMTFDRRAPGAGVLDADHGFGHAAAAEAVDRAVALAAEAGVGAVSVRNSSHCGALAYAVERAAAHDMIGMGFTHASPSVLSFDGTRPFFGTNPICCVVPVEGGRPFCYDAAMAAITANKLRSHRDAGTPLPPGVAADAAGVPTTDPATAAQLLPIGGYKGFGLMMVVDILCSMLSGMPAGRDVSRMFQDPMSQHRLLGHFFLAIRIGAFADPAEFKRRMKALVDQVRGEPTREGRRVRVPGDPENEQEDDRRAAGIPLGPALYDQLVELGASCRVGGLM